jgi:hypothetical protein
VQKVLKFSQFLPMLLLPVRDQHNGSVREGAADFWPWGSTGGLPSAAMSWAAEKNFERDGGSTGYSDWPPTTRHMSM